MCYQTLNNTKSKVFIVSNLQTCSVDNCDNQAVNRRGWCSKHYIRWRKYGDVHFVKQDKSKIGHPCEIDGCSAVRRAKGLCQKHYKRMEINGSPHIVSLNPHYRKKQKWIEKHKSYTGSECLIWPFAVNKSGRGMAHLNGKSMSAPRGMCLAAHGQPPTTKHQAAHSCGQGHIGCVNPNHLSWKTAKENERDKVAHGTLRYGEDINTAKLTESDVRNIRAEIKTTAGVALAQKYGVTPSCISSIKHGHSWRRVK